MNKTIFLKNFKYITYRSEIYFLIFLHLLLKQTHIRISKKFRKNNFKIVLIVNMIKTEKFTFVYNNAIFSPYSPRIVALCTDQSFSGGSCRFIYFQILCWFLLFGQKHSSVSWIYHAYGATSTASS